MIVKYVWYTRRYNRHWREWKKRSWTGWFLFGFIPLLIINDGLTIS